MHKLMGFFKYDTFPYVVAFEVSKVDEKGRCHVQGVGYFTPSSTLTLRPIRAGKVLKEQIDAVAAEHRKRQRAVTSELRGRVEDMLGVKVK